VSFAAPAVTALLAGRGGQLGGLKGVVRDEHGETHRQVNVYVNNEPIDPKTGLRTPLRDGDEAAIIPALAGGSSTPAASARAIAGARSAADRSLPMSGGR